MNAEGPKFEVGCAGDLIDDFATAREALSFAQWSADRCRAPHEILDAQTHTALVIVEPRAA